MIGVYNREEFGVIKIESSYYLIGQKLSKYSDIEKEEFEDSYNKKYTRYKKKNRFRKFGGFV